MTYSIPYARCYPSFLVAAGSVTFRCTSAITGSTRECYSPRQTYYFSTSRIIAGLRIGRNSIPYPKSHGGISDLQHLLIRQREGYAAGLCSTVTQLSRLLACHLGGVSCFATATTSYAYKDVLFTGATMTASAGAHGRFLRRLVTIKPYHDPKRAYLHRYPKARDSLMSHITYSALLPLLRSYLPPDHRCYQQRLTQHHPIERCIAIRNAMPNALRLVLHHRRQRGYRHLGSLSCRFCRRCRCSESAVPLEH